MSWLGILRLHDWVYRDLSFGSDVCLQWFGVWAGEQKESPHLRSPRGARVGVVGVRLVRWMKRSR